jgi:DNA-binding transcriptional LysR family regulator
VDVAFLPWRGGEEAAAAVIAGEADLAVSVLPTPDDRCRRVQLFDEQYRVVMDSNHPAAARFDLESWLSYKHVLVSAVGGSKAPLDDRLQQLGRKRRIGLVVPSFMMVPEVLLSSDLIAMLPTRCIPNDPRFTVRDPPIAVEGFPVHMGWHRRHDAEPAIQHVSQLIAELFV